MIQWNKYVDKIYCIHLVDFKDRYNNLISEFKRVGIDTNADYFEWRYTIKNYFLNIAFNSKELNKFDSIHFTEPRFECVVHHYEIMKTALVLGYNKILIFEDDFKFLKDLTLIEDILNNIPEGFDLILLDKQAHEDYLHNITYDYEHKMLNKYFYDYTDQVTYLISAVSYIVNRNMMQYCVNLMERFIMSIDYYFNIGHCFRWNLEDDDIFKLKKTFTIKSIAIQHDHINNETCDITEYFD